jgi:hypothetical protein
MKGDPMKAFLCIATLCLTLTDRAFATNYVYQAVPFVLADQSTGDEYTIGGTFTVDCNDCSTFSVAPPSIIDWTITVDGPSPFTFTPLTSDLLNQDLFVTPSNISLAEFFLVTFEGAPIQSPASTFGYSFNPSTNPPTGTILYEHIADGSNAVLQGAPLDANDRFVIGTSVPEPGSAVLCGLTATVLFCIRRRQI